MSCISQLLVQTLFKNMFGFLGWNSDSLYTYPWQAVVRSPSKILPNHYTLFWTGVWRGDLQRFLLTSWFFVTLRCELESSSFTLGSESHQVPCIFLIETVFWLTVGFGLGLVFCWVFFSLLFFLWASKSSENRIFYRKDSTCLSPPATFVAVILVKGNS